MRMFICVNSNRQSSLYFINDVFMYLERKPRNKLDKQSTDICILKPRNICINVLYIISTYQIYSYVPHNLNIHINKKKSSEESLFCTLV